MLFGEQIGQFINNECAKGMGMADGCGGESVKRTRATCSINIVGYYCDSIVHWVLENRP